MKHLVPFPRRPKQAGEPVGLKLGRLQSLVSLEKQGLLRETEQLGHSSRSKGIKGKTNINNSVCSTIRLK